ncbi:hypothetical protein BH09ACT6_BH09ACT6_16160 [soil metagenome]
MHSRKRNLFGVLAIAGSIALVASGCSEGGGSTVANTSGSGGTVKIGVMTSVGSGLSNYPDIQAGAEAAVKQINADGGVNGKNVELDFCNTQGDATQAQACARQLDSDGVVATAGRIDIFDAQSFPILEAAGIPDIGSSSGGAAIDYTSPMSFPLSGGNFGAYTALPYAFQTAGAKSMVVATIDLPVGTVQAGFAQTVAQNIGLDVKQQIKIPSTGVTDYSPYVQKVIDSGADSVIVELGPAGFQAYVKAAAALGSMATIGGTAFTFGQSEAAGVGALANTMLVTAPYPSVDDKANPGIAQYHKELDADGVSNDPSVRRYGGLNAWLAMHAAADVAKTIKGDITRQSMITALTGTTGLDLYGLTTYSPSTLTSDMSKNAFGRFPAEPYYAQTFQSPTMVDAGQKPIPDPLSTVR